MISANLSLPPTDIVLARPLGTQRRQVARLFGLLCVMQNVSLVGPPKTGKTSILRHVANPQAQREHRLDPSRFLCCYLSLGSLECVGPQEFFDLMLLGMIRQARRRSALTQLHSRPAWRPTSYIQLLSYLEQAEMIGLNLVWTLDDFDALSGNHNLDYSFFSALRALASIPRVALVTATHHGLYGMGEPLWPVGSSLAGLFVTLPLSQLRLDSSQPSHIRVSDESGLQHGGGGRLCPPFLRGAHLPAGPGQSPLNVPCSPCYDRRRIRRQRRCRWSGVGGGC